MSIFEIDLRSIIVLVNKIVATKKEHCWTVPPCTYQHWRPALNPSCTEMFYPGCWHFDNGATSKVDDVLIEQGGQFLKFFGGTILRHS